MDEQDLQAEITQLRNENIALRQLIEVYEKTSAQQAKRLEETLALLSREQHSLAWIQQQSENDALTGLPKRAVFTSRLHVSLKGARANPGYPFAVLSIGLDRFQMVNDTMGHKAGNELLRGVARRLVASVRSTDMVGWSNTESAIARLGGDEFAVLLENVKTVENARQVSARIQECLSEPFQVEGREIFASASIGVALSTSTYQSAEEVLRDAEMAMCRAKVRGKGRSQVFDEEMRTNALVRWELETDLRRAVERNELRVYYQPKVVIASREMVGFEALLRWEHPKRGLISPMQFIPIAEESGQIIQIGNWVLREACSQVKQWNEKYRRNAPLSLSVNISSCQFADCALFDHIAAAVYDTGFDPQHLWLEITESNLMDNTEFAVGVLDKLKAMGVGLMIDDFGTGYSSLNYLSRFPFDTLKIDQSFVSAMESGADAVEMVKAMLGLASSLGMSVVAEGIETPGQLRHLESLGCSYGQGYLFSRPVAPVAAEQMLVDNPEGTAKMVRRSVGASKRQVLIPAEPGKAMEAAVWQDT